MGWLPLRMFKKSLSEEVTFGQRLDNRAGEGQVTVWRRAFQAEGIVMSMPWGREVLGPRTSMEPMWLEWSEQGQCGGMRSEDKAGPGPGGPCFPH